MKKTSKKLLSIILAMLMVATTIPTFAITAFASKPPECYCTNPNHSFHYYVTEINGTTVKQLVYSKSNFLSSSNETMSWWNDKAHITPKENTWYCLNSSLNYEECTDAAKKKYTMEDIAKGMGDDLYFYWDDETMDFVAVFMTYVDDTYYCHSYINTDELNENNTSVISAISVEEADAEGYEAKINLNADFNIDINEQGEVVKIKTGDYILNKAEPGKTIDEIKSLIGNDIFYYVYNETQFGKVINGIYVKNNEIYQNDEEFFDKVLLTKKFNDNTYAVCSDARGFMFFILKDGKLDTISMDWEEKPVYEKDTDIEIAKCTLKHKGDCQNEANGVHYVVNYNKLFLDKGMIIANVFDNGKLRYTTMLHSNPTFTKTLKDGNILTIKKGTENEYVLCPNAYLDLNKPTHTHKWDKGTVTKKATYTATGVKTFKCSCGKTKTETIAKLKITSAVKYKNSTKMDAGFKVTSSTKNITVNWGKVADADGYMVYANYCGNNTKPILIKTIKGADTKTYSFSKLNGKKLDLNKNFKVYVVAYKTVDGKKVEFGKTITGHVVGGKNKTYTNPTKVTVKNAKVTLAVNKTSKISATVTYKYANKKHLSDGHAAEKRYRSSNKAVATVDANGKITAVGKGTCTVYVFAKNGTSAKVTVTVK